MTQENNQHIIKEIDASMRMEGMPLTPEDKNRINRYLDNQIDIDEAIAEITRKYQR